MRLNMMILIITTSTEKYNIYLYANKGQVH